jgi:hypothetical protein
MNEAIFGLIGVAVGAVFTTVLNLVLERRQRLKRAKLASRLIATELSDAKAKVTSAVQSPAPSRAAEGEPPGWWLGDLDVAAWTAYKSDLLTMASHELLRTLASAYAICVSLNDDHAAARKTDAAPQEDLQADAATLGTAIGVLENAPKLRPLKWWQETVRWTVGLAVPGLVLVLALGALFAPRADVNATTVASALQSQLGSGALVTCRPRADEWACRAYGLSARVACPAARTLSFAAEDSPAVLVSAPVTPECAISSPPDPFLATVNPQGQATAAIVYRSGKRDVVREAAGKIATTSGWSRFLHSIGELF